ncbi:MAG: hypothetical protein R3228_10590 [Halioglobus sp.]|nr:hypothetical protein [Halioglobus sp.]
MSTSVVIISVLLLAAAGALGVFILRQVHKSTPKPARRQSGTAARKERAAAPASKRGKKSAPSPAATNPFRSTSIVLGKPACDAARELAGTRFLVDGDTMPPLPLPGCDVANCSCKYKKHRDRRTVEGDRRALGDHHLARLRYNIDDERRGSEHDRREESDFEF